MAYFDADEYRKGGWRAAVDREGTHYQRLGLSAAEHLNRAEVVLAHRARANWWRQRGAQMQSGKNNPLIAELAPFIKPAEDNLQLALAVLSDVDRKAAYDRQIAEDGAKANEGKLADLIRFTLRDKILTATEEYDLLAQAHEMGILQERAEELIRQEMIKTGATEEGDPSVGVLRRRAATGPVVTRAAGPRQVLNQAAFSFGTLGTPRRRPRLFWTGLLAIGAIGLLLYAMAPSTWTRDAMANAAVAVRRAMTPPPPPPENKVMIIAPVDGWSVALVIPPDFIQKRLRITWEGNIVAQDDDGDVYKARVGRGLVGREAKGWSRWFRFRSTTGHPVTIYATSPFPASECPITTFKPGEPQRGATLEDLAKHIETQIDAGSYDGALQEAERAVQLYPNSARARALLERVRRIRSVLK